MSIEARREYLRAIWKRYREASRRQKSMILSEFVQVTGLNRKYAIWRLGQPLERFAGGRRAGAPRRYDRAALLPFVRELWLAMEQVGAKRMKAAIPIWLPFFENEDFRPEHRDALLRMSASTLERILHSLRQALRPRGIGTTRAGGYLLRHRIPIQTRDFNITGPGHLEGDTVAHCGGSMAGEFVHTVTHTDIFSSWTELRAVANRGALAVLEATKDMERSLPFSVLSADYDNGGEFINHDMESYWTNREPPVKFVRSRAYRKNDQCYVEQKNFTHVRELFGYDRITGRDLTARMDRIYRELWGPLHNHFLPCQKLLTKSRVGARIVKRYDPPRTPYQRLQECAAMTEEAKAALRIRHERLNPFQLRLRLEMELKDFFEQLRARALCRAA